MTERWTIGSDEAGYGTWAGDLVVAATALPETWNDAKVTDSKKLSESRRRAAVSKYRKSVPWAIRKVTPEELDEGGVWNCLVQAHADVQNELRARLLEDGVEPSAIRQVVDGLENAHMLGQLCTGVVKCMARADQTVPAVSLASCFAKTEQVKAMQELSLQHPKYLFADHCGYGTPAHKKVLDLYGPLKGVHRFSYSSIKKLAEDKT
jgi:ribonuclease HII